MLKQEEVVTRSRFLQVIMPPSISGLVVLKRSSASNTPNYVKLKWFHVLFRLIKLIFINLKSANSSSTWAVTMVDSKTFGILISFLHRLDWQMSSSSFWTSAPWGEAYDSIRIEHGISRKDWHILQGGLHNLCARARNQPPEGLWRLWLSYWKCPDPSPAGCWLQDTQTDNDRNRSAHWLIGFNNRIE